MWVVVGMITPGKYVYSNMGKGEHGTFQFKVCMCIMHFLAKYVCVCMHLIAGVRQCGI